MRNKFLIYFIIACISVLLSIESFAQILTKLEIDKVRAGEKAELIIRGRDLLKVIKVESVKFDDDNLDILDYTMESDSILSVDIRIPSNAKPGEHQILVLVSNESSTIRLSSNNINIDRMSDIKYKPKIQVQIENHIVNNNDSSLFKLDSTFIGNPTYKTFTVKNIGLSSLLLNSIEVPTGFTLIDTIPRKIVVGDYKSFRLKLDADTIGNYNGVIQINTNASENSPYNLRISGIVIPDIFDEPDPQLTIIDSSLTVANQNDTSNVETVEPVSLIEESNILVEVIENGVVTKINNNQAILFESNSADTQISKTFRITNKSNFSIALNSIKIPKGFSSIGSIADSLLPGQASLITIQFDSPSESSINGVLVFGSDIDESTFQRIDIIGNVVVPNEKEAIFPWKWVIPLVVLLTLIAGLYLLYRKGFLKKLKWKTTKNFKSAYHFKPHIDFGNQYIKNPVKLDVRFRIKPNIDFGSQILHANGDLIQHNKISSSKNEESNNDDLTLIEGIGPVISEILYSNDIRSFEQLASVDIDYLRQLLSNKQLWISDPTTWPEQANLAFTKNWKKLDMLKKELKGGVRVS